MTILYRVDDDDDGSAKRADRSSRRTPRWLRIGRLLVTVAVAGGVVFGIVTIYGDGGDTVRATDVPIVLANLAETRERPEQPGGMDVPHRDRVILQRGPTEDAELLSTALVQAPAEEPLPPESLPAPSDGQSVGRVDPSEPEVLLQRLAPGEQLDAPTPEPVLAEPLLPDVPPAELVLTPTPLTQPPIVVDPPLGTPDPEDALEVDALDDLVAAVQDVEVEQVERPALDVPVEEETSIEDLIGAVAVGGFRVQLAALQSEGAVAEEWRRMVRLYPDLLQGQEPLISNPETGRLVRMSAGPMAEADARLLCGTISQRGGDCFVRPID